MKINVVKVEYNLDKLMEKRVVVEGTLIRVEDVLKGEKSVARWYRNTYHENVLNMRKGLSWYDLFEQMRKGVDIYKILGVGDSVVRERVFAHLSRIMNVPYDMVYNLWTLTECSI